MPKIFAIFVFVRVGDKDRAAFYDDLLRHQILLFAAPNLRLNILNLANVIVKFNGSNLLAELVNLTVLNAHIGLKFDRFVANGDDLDVASAVWQI